MCPVLYFLDKLKYCITYKDIIQWIVHDLSFIQIRELGLEIRYLHLKEILERNRLSIDETNESWGSMGVTGGALLKISDPHQRIS